MPPVNMRTDCPHPASFIPLYLGWSRLDGIGMLVAQKRISSQQFLRTAGTAGHAKKSAAGETRQERGGKPGMALQRLDSSLRLLLRRRFDHLLWEVPRAGALWGARGKDAREARAEQWNVELRLQAPPFSNNKQSSWNRVRRRFNVAAREEGKTRGRSPGYRTVPPVRERSPSWW